jgi:hypothetical protein
MNYNGSISTIGSRDASEQRKPLFTLYPDGSNSFERGVALLQKNILQLYARLGHSKGAPSSPQHQRQDDVLSSLVFVVSQLSQLQLSSKASVEVSDVFAL